MSKKKKIIATTAMLLAITASFLGGQTFSKYVTEIKGSGKAEVAAWSFKAYGENEQTQTVNLASTVNDATLLNNKIAPGTKGSFVIRIDGRGSDVGINYNLKAVNETQRPQNLIYTCKGITYPDIEHLMAASGGTIDANDPEKVKEVVVEWLWPYETQTTSNPAELIKNDAEDTKDGQTISDYTFDIVVTGTQVIPSTANE